MQQAIRYFLLLALIALIGAPLPSFADEDALFTSWDKIFSTPPGAPEIQFGVILTGPHPYSENSDVLFIPASNTKLFTTAAALENLGPDYRFETRLDWHRVRKKGQDKITDLNLVASGDPSWGLSELGETLRSRIDLLVAGLKSQGVTEIEGPIRFVSDDIRWDRLNYPTGWENDDAVSCYGALAQAFDMNRNCATYLLRQGAWQEEGVLTPVHLDIQKGEVTRLLVQPIELGQPGFIISGTLAEQDSPSLSLPILDPQQWIRQLFLDSLHDHGISVYPQVPPSHDPALRSISFYSPPLSEILRPFLKESMNLIGDALFKKLGETLDASASDLLMAGQTIMKGYLSNTFSEFENAVLWDGSGVSRFNRVTPSLMMSLLQKLQETSDFKVVWDSLPIAGVDGTLAKRMRGTPAEGVLRAKTGTVRGAYNLSGYIPQFDAVGDVSEYFPFVMLTNAASDDPNLSRNIENHAGAALAAQINGELSLDKIQAQY